MNASDSAFHAERNGSTLIVCPLGVSLRFRYREIHIESNRLYRMLDDPDVNNVLIDLQNIDTMDKVILNAVLRLLTKARNDEGHVGFCNGNQSILQVLQQIKVGPVWPYFMTREDALHAFEAAPPAPAPEEDDEE